MISKRKKEVIKKQKNKLNINEDYYSGNFTDVYDSILKYESNTPSIGSAFITDNGTFINLKGDHGRIFGDVNDYEVDDFYTLENEFNLIKMNGGSKNDPYPYIDIYSIPNQRQKEAIITWLYFLIERGINSVQINNDYFVKEYNLKEMLPEEILKDYLRNL